jgi:opacity protein-like surface antigen
MTVRSMKVWLCGMFAVAALVRPCGAADTDTSASAGTATTTAATTEGRGREGLYMGLGLVYAPSAFDLGDDLKTDNSFGLDARLGYRLCKRVAVEGQYQYVPGFDVDFEDHNIATINTNTFTLNGKVYALPEDSLQPYFLGGIGFLHAGGHSDIPGASLSGATGFAGRVGIGADYYLTNNVILNVEFTAVLPTGPVSDLRVLPLVFGAQYRF